MLATSRGSLSQEPKSTANDKTKMSVKKKKELMLTEILLEKKRKVSCWELISRIQKMKQTPLEKEHYDL